MRFIGLRFFYLKNVKLSKDGNTVTFFYYDFTKDEIARNTEILDARLSHLLYNTAPGNYSELQKFMAVHQYICEISITHPI